jgi:hypothetical protein
MRKTLALVSLVAALVAAPVQAQESEIDHLIRQEQARGLIEPAPASGAQILAQERGRGHDARVFGALSPAPVQVVGSPDGFDYTDAGIGGAAALAFALMAAAGVAVWSSSRRRTA